MKNYICRATSVNQLMNMWRLMLSCGYTYGSDTDPYGSDTDLSRIVKNPEQEFDSFPFLKIMPGDKSLNAFEKAADAKDDGGDELTPEEFFAMDWTKMPRNVEIKLNADYTAVIHSDKVVVGCQTFGMDAINKLVEAWKNRDVDIS